MARTKLSETLTGWSDDRGPRYSDTTDNRGKMVVAVDEHSGALDAAETTLVAHGAALGTLTATSSSWFLPDVANTFDPTVAPGLAGGAGAMVRTADHKTAWVHGNPIADPTVPDTDWNLI